jgi:hypothetical protein
MTRYEFGVMSSKWELEADDMYTAYITMSLFIGQNIPIAVYCPQEYGFMPKDILDNNMENFKPDKVRECYKTIKEIKEDKEGNNGN